jgi:hypothetical protein
MKKKIFVLLVAFAMLLVLSAVCAEVNAQRGEYNVITNLSGLNLIYHDLANSALLESIMLNDLAGSRMTAVTVVVGGENTINDGQIFNDAGAIELYYFARSDETAVESVIWSANTDIEEIGFFSEGSNLVIGPIRASADHQTAYLTIIEEMENGYVLVCFYIAQNIPGSNGVLLLDVVLYTNLWDSDSDTVLTELSELIGVDMNSYLP